MWLNISFKKPAQTLKVSNVVEWKCAWFLFPKKSNRKYLHHLEQSHGFGLMLLNHDVHPITECSEQLRSGWCLLHIQLVLVSVVLNNPFVDALQPQSLSVQVPRSGCSPGGEEPPRESQLFSKQGELSVTLYSLCQTGSEGVERFVYLCVNLDGRCVFSWGGTKDISWFKSKPVLFHFWQAVISHMAIKESLETSMLCFKQLFPFVYFVFL